MKIKKLLISSIVWLVLILVALPLLTACAEPAAPVLKLNYGTTSAGSGQYAMMAAVAEIWNEEIPEVSVTVMETGATIDNVKLLRRGDLQIGFATFTFLGLGYHGGLGFEGEANPDLRTLFLMWSVPHALFVTQASGVTSVYELEGKNFGAGITGSATEMITEALFDANGVTPNWFRGDVAAARDATKNRTIIGYSKTGEPDPSILDVASVLPIRILEVPEEWFAKAEEAYPGMVIPGILPANTYSGQNEDIVTFMAVSGIGVTKDLPTDIGYEMCKSVYAQRHDLAEAFSQFRGKLPDFPEWTVKTAKTPLHAGAVEFFREMGVHVPDELIPPEAR